MISMFKMSFLLLCREWIERGKLSEVCGKYPWSLGFVERKVDRWGNVKV